MAVTVCNTFLFPSRPQVIGVGPLLPGGPMGTSTAVYLFSVLNPAGEMAAAVA